GGQVQAFGAGGRHDVAGVADQEHTAKRQRLGDKAAQGRDALFNRGAGNKLGGDLGRNAALQFFPEGLVGPILNLIFQRHLYIVAAERGRALAAQGKAAFVVGVDELFVHGRGVREQAQPAKGVDTLEVLDFVLWDGLAAHAVEAVTAGDVVAVQLYGFAVFFESHAWFVGVEVVNLHILGFVDAGAAFGLAGVHQV